MVKVLIVLSAIVASTLAVGGPGEDGGPGGFGGPFGGHEFGGFGADGPGGFGGHPFARSGSLKPVFYLTFETTSPNVTPKPTYRSVASSDHPLATCRVTEGLAKSFGDFVKKCVSTHPGVAAAVQATLRGSEKMVSQRIGDIVTKCLMPWTLG